MSKLLLALNLKFDPVKKEVVGQILEQDESLRAPVRVLAKHPTTGFTIQASLYPAFYANCMVVRGVNSNRDHYAFARLGVVMRYVDTLLETLSVLGAVRGQLTPDPQYKYLTGTFEVWSRDEIPEPGTITHLPKAT